MGNSSSTPSSSTTTTTTTHGEFDVFISFRGTDTRKSFTSHLYRALDEKNITTFIDTKLVRGEAISDGLWRAIGESKISVVIFSENYAFSKWCLRELTEIMECRKMKKQIVIPVFYEVDPSHVKKQIGSYEAAFAKHENELQQDVVKKWRDALTRASNISGWDSSVARDESELVCNIVSDVWKKLYNISPSCDFKGLVGIDKHIERVVSLLCLGVPDFRIIGIWGMGGMGKTTIADAVFQLLSHQFEKRTYFARCVGAKSEEDLFRLRDEILSKVLNKETLKLDSPSIPQWIKEMLNRTKVLIVLDDVNKSEILDILAKGLDRFGPESRIILTSRNKQVLRNFGVEDHNMYEVKGLNPDEALQLFCNYAFKQNHPTKDFEVLSGEVVKIATNLPLAVKVLGSSLYKKSKRDWQNAKDKFQRNVNPKVFDVLKISYDGLEDEEEKDLFLDIACFDELQWFNDTQPNLLSGREFALGILIDKSLVTVEYDDLIEMHDSLREMGREIASKNRSRLWREKDVLRTLKHNDGTDAVQGIFLNMLKLKDVHLIYQALRKMYNLRTLIIKYKDCEEDSDEEDCNEDYCNEDSDEEDCNEDYCDEDYCDEDYDDEDRDEVHLRNDDLDYLPDEEDSDDEDRDEEDSDEEDSDDEDRDEVHLRNDDLDYLPDELRYLHWKMYPLEILPSGFNPLNLVELDLSHSNIKQLWEGTTCVPKLKRLNLSYCQNLIRIPDLSDIPSAESINLIDCISLLEIHSSMERQKNLHSLKLSGCKNLSRFPSNIHIEGSEFSLVDCISLTKFPHISGNIKRLDLSKSGVEEVPSTIQSLSKLESLFMVKCTRLKHISKSICKLKSLVWLVLIGCCKLESYQHILEGMELTYLNLSEMATEELLLKLNYLNLNGCSKQEKFPPLCSLKDLRLKRCKLTEISEDIGCLSSLERLELEGNDFERLPKSIKKLSKLRYLSLRYCGMLRSLSELPSSLRRLEAMNCRELIQSLPDESEFELCADGGVSFIFNFMNCLKLNQKAVSNLFRDSLSKIQRMGTEKIISLFEQDEVKNGILSICLPGSEIPEWFSCYKNIGSSINIPALRNDCGRSNYIMGFAVCLVFGFDQDYDHFFPDYLEVNYDIHIETSDGHKEGFIADSLLWFDMPKGSMDSDHIVLVYDLSRKCYEFFQELDTLLANRGMSDYVVTSFEFDILFINDCDSLKIEPKSGKVKHCGIKPIYVQSQVMNSVAIDQDTGDTSGSNDTEETCEPHHKRICTEANRS